MKAWTVQDEINLCKWVDDRGFIAVCFYQMHRDAYVMDMPCRITDEKVYNPWEGDQEDEEIQNDEEE